MPPHVPSHILPRSSGFQDPDGFAAKRQIEEGSQSAVWIILVVLPFLLCFKGCAPVPNRSNRDQMCCHIAAPEAACCFQTNNAVTPPPPPPAIPSPPPLPPAFRLCYFPHHLFIFEFDSLVLLKLNEMFPTCNPASLLFKIFQPFFTSRFRLSFCLMCSDLQAWLLSGSTAH